MKQSSTKTNQSLEKAMQIIEHMADYGTPIKLQDLAIDLGIPSSTAWRFLSTLEKMKYVKQDESTLRYSLTFKLCKLSNQIRSHYNIRDIVRPHLIDLARQVGESVCLAIEENHRAMYVDVARGPDNILNVTQRIGKEAPLYCTGVGKLMLLNYDESIVKEIITTEGMEPLTHNTIVTPDRLLSELKIIREKQYAVDDEECEIGVRCIAAPIYDYTGRIIASISASGPVSRMSIQKIDQVKQAVMESAARISIELGYDDTQLIKASSQN